MNRHKHADLIHAWADGAEIEGKVPVIQYDSKGCRWVTGEFKWCKIKDPSWYNDMEYRIKSKEPLWYENIPEQGVLCWYNDAVVLVTDYYPNCNGESSVKLASAKVTNDVYLYTKAVIPLTNEEIERFKR